MKPFRFPLQALRVLREQSERIAQKRYADALRACEAAAASLQAASEELTACWTTLGRDLEAGVTGLKLLRTRAWCNVLELRLKERATALEQARHAVDAVWQEMMNATRDRKTIDRHYEKTRRVYDLRAQREDQKSVDELAVQMLPIQGALQPVTVNGRPL